MTIDSNLTTGIIDPIKNSFSSVFNELNASFEAFTDKTKLLTIGRDNYAKFLQVRIGEFPLFGTNRVANVADIYTKVCISDQLESDKYKPRHAIERNLRIQKSGGEVASNAITPMEAINKSKQGFALLGSPGSGKSTTFRYIAIEAATGTPIRGKRRIPIFLAAREMTKNESTIISAAIEHFSTLEFEKPEKLLEMIAASGNLLLLLDGADETTPNHRQALFQELIELRSKYPDSCFCVSARPYSLSIGLQNFEKWETQPLSFDERINFVAKWFSGLDAEKGKQLIISCKATPAILDLGSSPLLLSIVCALYYNDLEVPQEPEELYDRAVLGLMGQWDAFRTIARKTPLASLSILKRIALVSELAARLFDKGMIVFSIPDIEGTAAIKRFAERLRLPDFDTAEIVESLSNDFGLLMERAPGNFSFSHLTVQEFLTAKYIVSNRTEINLVTEYRKDSRWAEVIKLTAKMIQNPEPFIEAIHAVTDLSNHTQVETLSSLWSSNPMCDQRVRDRLMHEISTSIARSLKDNGATDIKIESDSITICCGNHEFLSKVRSQHIKAQKKADDMELLSESEKQKKRANPSWIGPHIRSSGIIAITLPALLDLLKLSQLTLKELSVSNVKLFEIWDSLNRPRIRSVSFTREQKIQ